MERQILDGIELIIARDHALLSAADVDFVDRRQKMSGIDEPVEIAIIERDRFGVFAAAIDDGWNAAFTANATGGPLACPAAHRGRELFRFGHVGVLICIQDCGLAPPGVSETAAEGGL